VRPDVEDAIVERRDIQARSPPALRAELVENGDDAFQAIAIQVSDLGGDRAGRH
jgi:hypothetical protein